MSSTIPVLDAVYQSPVALSSDLILIVVGVIALLLGITAALLKRNP